MRHDCSTLGGNSGSVVLSLATGDAVGLHFAGRFLEANFAVSSGVVAQRLDDVQKRAGDAPSSAGRERGCAAGGGPTAAASARSSATLTYLVPLSITVEIGDPYQAAAAAIVRRVAPIGVGAGDSPVGTARSSSRRSPRTTLDREGYDASFLGDGPRGSAARRSRATPTTS